MIPKIIHFCWFGNNKYPPKVEFCIDSWKKKLPDYEFMLWNEENFDVSRCEFTREAYNYGKYAFVSDYVRLYALCTYGGIYLDTDIEVLRRFDSLLDSTVLLGTDEYGNLTAFMASVPNHPYFLSMLDFYETMSFIDKNGRPNEVVNNQWMQKKLKEYGYVQTNIYQEIEQGIKIYPDVFFHAKSLVSGKEHVTNQTFCIHHHTLLWVSKKTKLIRFLRMKLLVPVLGSDKYIRYAEWAKTKGRVRNRNE